MGDMNGCLDSAGQDIRVACQWQLRCGDKPVSYLCMDRSVE